MTPVETSGFAAIASGTNGILAPPVQVNGPAFKRIGRSRNGIRSRPFSRTEDAAVTARQPNRDYPTGTGSAASRRITERFRPRCFASESAAAADARSSSKLAVAPPSSTAKPRLTVTPIGAPR